MSQGHTESKHRRTRHVALALLALLAVVALVALAAACGGDSVEGTYKYKEGDSAMEDFTLTLEGDAFTLSGPNPAGGDDLEISGTYTVDGEKITLTAEGENAEEGTIKDGELSFGGLVWEK